MGKVRKHSAQNALWSYAGVALGAFNALVLFPLAFPSTPEDMGLLRWILSASLLVGTFAHAGLPHTVVTYWSRTPEEQRPALLGFTWGMSLLSTVILLLFLFFYGEVGLKFWIEQPVNTSSLLVLSALTFFYVLFELLASMAQAQHNVVWPQVLKDFGRKAWILLSLCAYIVWELPLEKLLYLMAFGHGLLTLWLAVLMGYRSPVSFSLSWSGLPKKSLMVYGGFMVLTAGAQVVMGQMDLLLIGKQLDLSQVAFYSIAFQLGVVVAVPAKAMGYSLRPLIAEAWAKQDKKQLAEWVHRSTQTQWVATAFLFFLLWSLWPAINALLPPLYRQGPEVTLLIGLVQLIHVATGPSGLVLVSSHLFKWDFVTNAALILLTAILAWVWLPMHGLVGMGYALLVAALLYNGFKAYMTYRLLGIVPFTSQGKWLLFWAVVALAIQGILGWALSSTPPFLHSSVAVGMQSSWFVLCLLYTPLSLDFKSLIHQVVERWLTRKP